jgi:hypothetical protein|nr:MAG TPA: Putative virion structural protein 2 [Caudoviricetes sp.]
MSETKILERKELEKYVHNPEMAQKKILDLIDKVDKNEVVLTSATNPFTMLLEATAITTANSANETIGIMRAKYPNLALTRKDISHHLSDDEIEGLVSKPGSVDLLFRISVTDILSNGYRPKDAKYVEMTIPELTKITVYNTDLTILNDIVIRVYDNGVSFVEMQPNPDNPLALTDIGIIVSTIAQDEQGHPYVFFETKVQQLTVSNYNYAVVASEGFTKNIPFKSIDNKFSYVYVAYDNANTGGVPVKLPLGFNDEYLDPYTPTAYINIIDNDVTEKLILEALRVHIPDTYFLHNKISGTIYIDLYETKGNIYLPLVDALTSDFSIVLGKTGKNSSTAVSPNINIILGSRGVIANGSSGLNFNELRNAIIFNTKGDQNLPITDYQLSYNNQLDGFRIMKDSDVLTGRSYVAMRNLDKTPSTVIRALQDVYFNTVDVMLERFINHPQIGFYEDAFIVKSNTIFKSYNSQTEIVSKEQMDAIKLLTNDDKTTYFREAKFFTNPYYYIISKTKNFSTARVYDLDRPTLTDMRIVGTNKEIEVRCNTNQYTTYKHHDGFEIVLNILKNAEAEAIDTAELHMVAAIDLVTKNKLFIKGTYDSTDNVYRFFIETPMYISEVDRLVITNGEATTYSNYSELITNISFYIYTTDTSVEDPKNFLVSELTFENRKIVVINKETMTLTFGKKIESIWSRIAVSYTERKYLRYKEDVYAYYEQDEYEKDPITGLIATVTDNSVTMKLLHEKGDKVLNEKGEHVILHRKGDVILNEKGLPIIDDMGGVIRHLDILMLDYEFYLATNPAYSKHNLMCIDQLNEYMLKILPTRNDKLLENTNLWYKSYKTVLPIRVRINNIIYGLKSIVSPKVTIYYNQNTEFKLTSVEFENIKDKIGFILDKYFENDKISLAEIRTAIMKELGSDVLSVKITGIDNANSELIYIEDKNTRLSLDKVLIINDYNQLEVKYNVDVVIQTL